MIGSATIRRKIVTVLMTTHSRERSKRQRLVCCPRCSHYEARCGKNVACHSHQCAAATTAAGASCNFALLSCRYCRNEFLLERRHSHRARAAALPSFPLVPKVHVIKRHACRHVHHQEGAVREARIAPSEVARRFKFARDKNAAARHQLVAVVIQRHKFSSNHTPIKVVINRAIKVCRIRYTACSYRK